MANVVDKSRIPVTLVTGFLGAGKTTLLNHVLGGGSGRRIVVIENEFGDVGVDGSLVGAACQVLYELNDGCVCCSVREDLIAVFRDLLNRLEDIDHVIIETTGLAEPAPVMRIFELPDVRAAFELDGVVTVVDSAHIEESLDDVSACLEQIAYADLLILNKIDCVAPDGLESIEAHLKRLNPLASIQRAQHAQVDVDSLLELGGRRHEERAIPHHDHSHDVHHHDSHGGHDHAHGGHDHSHDEGIHAVVVELAGDINVAALDVWLGKLARRSDSPLLRMKGVLAVPGDPRRFVFNGVRDVVDVRPGRPWDSDTRFSRIVMIGRSLDSAKAQAEFAACMAQPAQAS